MKRLLMLLIVFIIATWVGLHIKDDPGYALFGYGHWVVEMPLWFTIFAGLVLFYSIHYCLLSLAYVTGIWGRCRRWCDRYRHRRSQNMTSQGLIQFSEGNWQTAEKYLLKAVEESETPLINYLTAARAAQEQAAFERRDEYLRLAHQSTPGAEVAVGLTQAQLQLRQDQLEQSLATLKHLQQLVPHHICTLKLLKQLYLRLADWTSLYEMMPELKKYKVLSTEAYDELNLIVYRGLLIQAGKHEDVEVVNQLWHSIPKAVQKNSDVIKVYIAQLMDKKQHDVVERLIRDTLKRQWDTDLVKLYGKLATSLSQKQLSIAEGWLKIHSQSPVLLLTLGRLSVQIDLWGKAREYFEASIRIDPCVETYNELARLYEQLGEKTLAMDSYRAGLQLLSSTD